MLETTLRLTDKIPESIPEAPSLAQEHVRSLNPVIPTEIDHSAERAYVSKEDVAAALNERVGRQLPGVLTLTLLYFASLVAYRWIFQPEERVLAGTSLAGTTAALMFGLRLLTGLVRLPSRWAHPLAFFLSGLILANCLLPLQSSPPPAQATLQAIPLLLLVIGTGCVFLSVPWLAATLLAIAGGWIGSIAASPFFSEMVPLSLGLLVSMALCLFIHGVRLKAYRAVLSSELEEAGRRERLEKILNSARQTEERYHRFSLATLEGIAVHARGAIVDANETLARLFGYAAEDLAGMQLQDLLAPESRPMLSEILDLGNYQSVEATGLRQDGSQFPIEIFNSVIPGEDKFRVAVLRDVTERKAAQQSLQFERQKEERIFDRQIALARLDLLSYTQDDLRRTWREIVQLSTQQLPASLGACLLMRMSSADSWQVVAATISNQPKLSPLPDAWHQTGSLISWMAAHQELLALPDLSNDPFHIAELFPDQPVRAFLAAPVIVENELKGILMVLDDKARPYTHDETAFCGALAERAAILTSKLGQFERLRQASQLLEEQNTQLRENIELLLRNGEAGAKSSRALEQQCAQLQGQNRDLKQAREAAEQESHAKTEFLAGVSREMAKPVNEILGMTRLLMDSALSPEQRSYADTLHESAETLRRMMSGTHALTLIELGQNGLQEENFNLANLVESLIDSFYSRAQQKGVELISWVDEDLPPELRGSASGLRQVLSCLIDNAINSTEKGEILLSVSNERATATQVEVRFLIHDTGRGISTTDLPDLFQPFHATGSTEHDSSGESRFGLFLCKRLVDSMHGQIGVDSTPGQGSDFWFMLSLAIASPGAISARPASQFLEGARALVINSNPNCSLVLQRLMTFHKMRTQGVSDPADGLRLLCQESKDPFHVVVLDAQDKRVQDALILALQQDIATRIPRILWLTSPQHPQAPASLPLSFKFASLPKPIHQSRFLEELNTLLKPQ